MLTNQYHTVLYTGVTSDLARRLWEHQTHRFAGAFTSRYKTYILVYYKGFHTIEEAIAREKQIKAGSRKKKDELIKGFNPEWKDLTNQFIDT